jgi:hypothetical protein
VAKHYPRLDKAAEAIVRGPIENRIQYIQRDRFIPYRAVVTILDLMEDFVNLRATR